MRWREEDKESIEETLKLLAKDRGLEFVGFVEEDNWRCGYTHLILKCPIHGCWKTTNLSNFVNLNYGCSTCKRGIKDGKSRLSDEEALRRFNKDGKFPTHHFIRNYSKRDKNQCYSFWKVHCSICEKDEISKAGLSDGWFSASTPHLRSGKGPCRCSKSYRIPEKELLYLLEQACNKRKCHITELHRKDSGKLVKSCKVSYLCNNGHTQTIPIQKFLLKDRGCNLCRLQSSVSNGYYKDRLGDKDCLYLLIYSDFIKVGRSFTVKDRIRFHVLNIGEDPCEVKLYTGTHQDIYNIEQQLLEDRVNFLNHTTETLPISSLSWCLSVLKQNSKIEEIETSG